FNINFEALTFARIDSFKELANKSLLTKHNISYQYSLSLIDKKRPKKIFDNEYVGFSPAFTSKMKEDYKLSLVDSTKIDKTYLSLLPQPWTTSLTQKSSRMFNGDAFTNEDATKQLFLNHANEHKIIHIGTHAESNNYSPEFSKLVFAKSLTKTEISDENSLYAYEIYNKNLNSELAILTACNTGKPTYQPGEGMISLAHAFNYAGSESILTSLWQIDEQSSTQILEHFYNYLEEGKRKDEALRLAKLDYLKTAEGRTLHPQYWAGLILMGDTKSIEISKQVPLGYWLVGLFFLVVVLVFAINKLKRS
ncbi:MAG: CHAT domain-containing protein, partial [Bacteroidota bacterium]